jgi:hypothetical protein
MLSKHEKCGRLAQLVELLPYKQAVTGSSPVPSIIPSYKFSLYLTLPALSLNRDLVWSYLVTIFLTDVAIRFSIESNKEQGI